MGIFFMVVMVATAAVVPGQTVMQATPAPVFAPRSNAGMGYYLMHGNTIVSAPFKNVSDCYTALAKAKSALIPGADTLVCAFRRP